MALTDAQKAAMGGPQQVPAVGQAWTPSDPFAQPNEGNLSAAPVRQSIQPGVNSPRISGIGWRREIRKTLAARFGR